MTLKILVIDDDVELLRQLATALTRARYEIHVATDGLVGLKRFNAVSPDLVLTDILMPNREGVETIVAMKEARPDVPILAMSGGGRIGPYEFLHLARHLGADEVIAKPFRHSDLIRVIEAMLAPAEAPG